MTNTQVANLLQTLINKIGSLSIKAKYAKGFHLATGADGDAWVSGPDIPADFINLANKTGVDLEYVRSYGGKQEADNTSMLIPNGAYVSIVAITNCNQILFRRLVSVDASVDIYAEAILV